MTGAACIVLEMFGKGKFWNTCWSVFVSLNKFPKKNKNLDFQCGGRMDFTFWSQRTDNSGTLSPFIIIIFGLWSHLAVFGDNPESGFGGDLRDAQGIKPRAPTWNTRADALTTATLLLCLFLCQTLLPAVAVFAMLREETQGFIHARWVTSLAEQTIVNLFSKSLGPRQQVVGLFNEI